MCQHGYIFFASTADRARPTLKVDTRNPRSMLFAALNTTNHLALRGPITSESAGALLHDALTRADPPEYLYLDTPGGEVLAGQRIIQLVVRLHLACIAMRAYSMGFAILQHCSRRWVVEGATLMQHSISVALQRVPLDSARSYLDMVHHVGQNLLQIQAERLNVTQAWFQQRTSTDWWLDHQQALTHRCADRVVHVWCTRALARRNVTLPHMDHPHTVAWPPHKPVYSACPLISTPLES